jgi:DNA modification methylase
MKGIKKEKRGGINFFNCDNIEFMKTKPDNYYDLAIVDPPYGIDADNKNNGKNSDRHEKTSKAKINTYKKPTGIVAYLLKNTLPN